MSPKESTEVRVEVEGRTLKLSNLDKVLYPRSGTTKGEVLNYYAQVSPVMLPLLATGARPGCAGPTAWRSRASSRRTSPTARRRGCAPPRYRPPGPGRRRATGTSWCSRSSTTCPRLTWLANLAALELHVHQWTVTKGGKVPSKILGANRLVIDLDPGDGAGLHECCQVALLVRDKLAERNLETEAVTSGSKGLHLYAALKRRKDPDDSTALAKDVAEELAQEHSKLVTATMTKSKRSGKVFLDWSQNAGSKTTLSPYSLRGRELPTVATPVTWDEVEAGAEDPLGLEQFRFEEVLERLADGR